MHDCGGEPSRIFFCLTRPTHCLMAWSAPSQLIAWIAATRTKALKALKALSIEAAFVSKKLRGWYAKVCPQ